MITRNVIANFAGQGWAAAMGFVFIPFYVSYLGISGYGIIGFFALLQLWLGVFEVSLSAGLNRKIASFTQDERQLSGFWDLIRTTEILALFIGSLIFISLLLSSTFIVKYWLALEPNEVDKVDDAIKLMGVIIGLRFIEGVYRSVLVGQQFQVSYNIIFAAIATLRGVGALLVLACISASITNYFLWQVFVSMIAVIVMRFFAYRFTPLRCVKPKFSFEQFGMIKKFTGGVLGITTLNLILTQIDKVLLSNLLSLEDFGAYMMASAAAGATFILIGPVVQAFYPKLCKLHTQHDAELFAETYHLACQLIVVIFGSLSLVMLIGSDLFMMSWTSNAEMSNSVSPLLSVIVLGNLLNGLIWLPLQAQLATGWTSLFVKVNFVALVLVVPTIILITPHWGAIGAAWIWVTLNVFYVVIIIHIMHKRILVGRKYVWYAHDTIKPLMITAIFIITSKKYLISVGDEWLMNFAQLTILSIFAVFVSLTSAIRVRERLFTLMAR